MARYLVVAADLGAAEIGATHQVKEPMQFAASGYRKRACSARSGRRRAGPGQDRHLNFGTRGNRLLPASPLRIGYLRCIPGMTGPCPKECA